MRPHGKYANVNPSSPEAFAQCDRCGFLYNRSRLVEQTQWAGQRIVGNQILVCDVRCFDDPNEQLRTIILPPDPPPVLNARSPNFAYMEAGPTQSTLTADVAQGATVLTIDDVTDFNVADKVWIQLNNAAFAQEEISAIDATLNTLTLVAPLPFSAPLNGTVTVSNP